MAPAPIAPAHSTNLDDIHAQVCAALPETDWSDARWGRLDTEAASLEFNLGTDDPVTSLMIHARGHATPVILHLIAVTGWVALDLTTGTWLNTSSNPDAGRQGFQSTLTHIAAQLSPPKPPSLLARLLRRSGPDRRQNHNPPTGKG